jgi:hypothetical protein
MYQQTKSRPGKWSLAGVRDLILKPNLHLKAANIKAAREQKDTLDIDAEPVNLILSFLLQHRQPVNC